MHLIQQVLFAVALLVASVLIARRVKYIAGAINLGRPEDRSDNPGERFKLMLLIAFGQKKMFANVLVGAMHFIIYAGFIIINLEILEIILDGIFDIKCINSFILWIVVIIINIF